MSLRDLEQNHADLSRIPSLEPNRLVGFINHFATSLVQQLSNFSNAADQRLYRLHSRITTCKMNLLILEKKLSSVDGLSIPAPAAANPVPPPPETHPELDHEDDDNRDELSPSDVRAEEGAGDEVDGSAKTEADPELDRFYKMLKVGVPLPAVRIKMASEGFDPDRLKV